MMTVVIDQTTGIQNPASIESSIVVRPNPTTGVFSIEINELNDMDLHVSISDLSGSRIMVRNIRSSEKRPLDV
jgi:hypothetical protein